MCARILELNSILIFHLVYSSIVGIHVYHMNVFDSTYSLGMLLHLRTAFLPIHRLCCAEVFLITIANVLKEPCKR